MNLKTLFGCMKTYHNWFDVLNPFNSVVDVKLRNGIVLQGLNREEVGAATEVFVKEIYNKYKKIEENDTVVDIGASVGDYCMYAVKSAKNVKVYAFEKDVSRANRALSNFRFNNISEVDISNICIEDGKELEEFIKKIGSCDFLKMDCEGDEFKIILSMKDFKNIKYISMECHEEGGDSEKLVDFLRRNGYFVVSEDFMKGANMIYAERRGNDE